tara:strand:- start:582 stop:782 length:201 start_codon:yes stop_codon:yes gene_type:complete
LSQEVALSVTDYHNLMNWYELAFAKFRPKDIGNKEHMTFRKLSVMAQALIEEEKELSKDEEEDGKC